MKDLNINEERLLNKDIQTAKIDRETSKKMTGYVSIDKPQLKYYRQAPIKNINPNQTIYELIFNENKENMNDEALGYLGVNWSYKKLKSVTDKLASSFSKIGIKNGDVVLIGVSNSLDAIATLLALNKIGAVSKWFDVRAGEKDIEQYANDSNCKCLVIFDMLIPKIQLILDNTNLENVVVMNPGDRLPILKKWLYKLKAKKDGSYIKIPDDKRFIKFLDLLKIGNKNDEMKCAKFSKDKPSIMIQSSGTTGKPKTIVHSDFSCTSCTNKIAYSDLPLGRGKKLLVALPPWIAYGLGDAIALPLALGTKVELSPIFSPEAVYKNIGKFTIAFAAPFNYRYLKEKFSSLTKKQKEQFEQVECLVSGGDKISIEENREFETVFNTKLVNGYGNNEGWGALTVNPINNNKYGTVGIPKYGETIISYDTTKNEELKYGEIGEICSLTDTMFLRYENNEEETNKIKKMHDDGNIWLHTGDLGFIDEDGYINLVGRTRRVIVRLAFKIAAYTIEDTICHHSAVKECVVVGVKDAKEEQVPMAYIVLKDEFKNEIETIKNDIYAKCKSELKEYEIPKYFEIVQQLPYTQNGKYDFRTLEQQGNDYAETINLDIKKKKLTL